MSEDSQSQNPLDEYLAWDGHIYEGSPPAGWYLANDSRWWPSEEIINESFGYAEPYAKEYLDDDEAFAAQYADDSSSGEPKRSQDWQGAVPDVAAPSLGNSQPSVATPPPSPAPARRIERPDFGEPMSPGTPLEPGPGEQGGSVAPPPRQRQRPIGRPSNTRRGGNGRRGISIVIFAAIALFRCAGGLGGDDSPTVTQPRFTFPQSTIEDFRATTPPTVPPVDSPVEQALVIPEPGETIEGPTPCPEADGSSRRTTQFSEAPPLCIDPDRTYEATIATDLGVITVALNASSAPSTVNNFVVLSRYRYYEGVAFHRIIEGFVIQGGDPVGPVPGTGGPGYTISEEPPAPGSYKVGSVAMAKTAEPQSTGGQFFIVTGPQGEALPADYSLLGEVTSGLEVVTQIESSSTDENDTPRAPTYITSITIQEN